MKGIDELRRRVVVFFNRKFGQFADTISADNPLAVRPIATREAYCNLAKKAAEQVYPEVDQFEVVTGYAIAPLWLHELALHTQVVIKKSSLCYAHGRILYSALSRFLAANSNIESINVVETGTARGFSSVCMARALHDMGRSGIVITFDVLPHRVPIYWNCIDDLERKKSREELLSPWKELVRKYLVFIQGDTRIMLPHISMGRVNFAFVDGAHSHSDVLFEFEQIAKYQHPGDVVVFDDYTPNQFPGLVSAVDEICKKYVYTAEKIFAHSGRGYVVATKAKV